MSDDRRRLHEADDPVHWEQPPGFDRAAALERVRRLRDEMARRAGAAGRIEDGFQDASCLAALHFDRALLTADPEARPIVAGHPRGLGPQIRVSCFGRLAVIVQPDALRTGIPAVVEAAIAEAGLVPVAISAVAARYDGSLRDREGRLLRETDLSATWFWRFFDYM